MVSLESLFSFMEANFEYILAVDGEERVIHASEPMKRDFIPGSFSMEGGSLSDLLASFYLSTFRSAMRETRDGMRGVGIFSARDDDGDSIPMKAGCVRTADGELFLFFGKRLPGFKNMDEWEKNERVKELTCLYEVAELIEVSSSIDEFFMKFPEIMSAGMLYPEEAVVHSVYQGVEYGQMPASQNFISARLVVGGQDKGEIRVGYHDDEHELLPEEQKLLDEIGRTLNLALDRKEFRDRLTLQQEESAEYARKLQELKDEIESRTTELEERTNKLGVVNSWLDRVNKNWEESKVRLETMFKAIPDEVVLLDKNRKVVMTNRKDVVPGEFCYKSVFHRDVPCEHCRLARILKEKTPLMLTMKQDDKYLQVHAVPVYNQEHEVDGILEFYRDVTLEKTYDQQLQQADKLASLGQLVSGIGHEINNPNQFIRGNIKIIKQALEDMLPIVDDYHKSHEDLKIARLNYNFFRENIMMLVEDMAHGSERIKGIVEGLRTFVRKDEGLLVDKVDINTLIEASTRLVHNQVHKHADIELDLTAGLPPFTGNSQKVEQVLINLMVNAGDAMPDSRKGTIQVRSRYEDGEIVVEVEDNGVGMSQNTLKQIFDPFFTTKRAKGGTGLGLAIAYRIIQEHGGTISVTSKAGVGTRFTIRIPAAAA